MHVVSRAGYQLRAVVAVVGLVKNVGFDIALCDWVQIEKAAIPRGPTDGAGAELVHLAYQMAVIFIYGVVAVLWRGTKGFALILTISTPKTDRCSLKIRKDLSRS